jgi:hypothetical protein
LEYIVHNGLPVVDPLYVSTIRLPEINYDILRYVLKIIDENYPYLRSSMKMIAYMMFIKTHEADKEAIRSVIHYYFQLIIEFF